MSLAPDLQFDVLTLVNEAQPSTILCVSDLQADYLEEYRVQRQLINQTCEITHCTSAELDALYQEEQRYDLGLLIGCLDKLDKRAGAKLLAHCRDVACAQYCLSIDHQQSDWATNDLFAFALSRVSQHESSTSSVTLYKYNIDSYKRTPDWLNADNWANPEMWNKYRW
jgi:hypothetical protein